MDVIDWIKQLNCRIKYVHIHQNNGINDEHLGLRYGNMPIKDILSALNEYSPEAVWALECKTDYMEDSISLLSELGYI